MIEQLRIVLFFWAVAFGAIVNSASRSDAAPLIGWGAMGTIGVCSLNAVTARALFSPSFFPDKLYALRPLAISLATYKATQEIYKQKISQKKFVYTPLLYMVPSLAAIGGAATLSWLWHDGSSVPLYVGAAAVASIPAMLLAHKYIKQEREINDIKSIVRLENEDVGEYVKRIVSFYQTISHPLHISAPYTNLDQIIILLEHKRRLREKLATEKFSCTFQPDIGIWFHGEGRAPHFYKNKRENKISINKNTIKDIFSEESMHYGHALNKLFISIKMAIQELVERETNLLVQNCSDPSNRFDGLGQNIDTYHMDPCKQLYYDWYKHKAVNMLQMKFIAKVLQYLPELVTNADNNHKIESILKHMPTEYDKDRDFYLFRNRFFDEAIKAENLYIIYMAGYYWFLNERPGAIPNIFKQIILDPQSTLSARAQALNFYRGYNKCAEDLTYNDDLKNIIKTQIKERFPIQQKDDFLKHWKSIADYCHYFGLSFEDEYLLKPLPNSCDTALHLAIKIDHEPLMRYISSNRDFLHQLLLTAGDDGKIPLEILFSDAKKYWKIIDFSRPAIHEILAKHQTDSCSFDQEILPIITKAIENLNKQFTASDLFLIRN